MAEQNLYTLQNQVSNLQERLDSLQVTMLDVMNKYGCLKKLEVGGGDMTVLTALTRSFT